MNIRNRKAVVLDMIFGRRDLYDRFIREIRSNPSLEMNILRSRIGNDGAWMKLELRGRSLGIDDLIRQWSDSTVALTRLPQAAA